MNIFFQVDNDGVISQEEMLKVKHFYIASVAWGFVSTIFRQPKVQCSLDIATGLRQGGWGRYRQRGRYIKGLWL